MLKIFLSLTVMFALVLADSHTSYANNNGFILTSIKEAQDISNATGQSMLIIFGSKNCPHCNKLYADISIIDKKYIDTYIICYIDLEKIEYENLKKEYKVSLIPDSRIFRKNKNISSIKGYKKTEYLEWLIKNK